MSASRWILLGVCGLVLGAQRMPAQAEGTPPSEREAQQALAKLATEQSQGSLSIVSFRKTDGIRRDFLGLYELEFEAEVLAAKDLFWKTEVLGIDILSFHTEPTQAEVDRRGGLLEGIRVGGMRSGFEVRARSLTRLKGRLLYERSERGWRLTVPMMRRVSSPVSASADRPAVPAPTRQQAPQPAAPSPPLPAHRVRHLGQVVAEGSLGVFGHGTDILACYSASGLVDIQPARIPMRGPCPQTKRLVHAGVDIVAPAGSEVRAFAHGTISDVVAKTSDPSFRALGYAVVLKHAEPENGKPTWSLYLHLKDPPAVKVGDAVRAGETVLGSVGSTGAAFGSHLHFELRHFPERISPEWENIYGVLPIDGGTFTPESFAAAWADPSAVLLAPTGALSEYDRGLRAKSFGEMGYRLYQQGDYAGAQRPLLEAANFGNSRAAGFLAFMYKTGTGVARDATKAVAFFQEAAQAGDDESAFNVGEMFATGEGVPRDATSASVWFAKALRGFTTRGEQGDPDAMAMLGRMHREALGTPRNDALALGWLRKAQARGHPRGTRLLGEMYLNGWGVRRDKAEATRLLEIAAQKGDPVAQQYVKARR